MGVLKFLGVGWGGSSVYAKYSKAIQRRILEPKGRHREEKVSRLIKSESVDGR